MDRKKVVEWVQKLMTKAADPASTEEERDAIQKKVVEFMTVYKITEMEATTPEEIAGHDMVRENVKFFRNQGKATWGYTLAWGIGPIFDCRVTRSFVDGERVMSFVGYPEDVATCAYFFRVLQLQIVGACDTAGYRKLQDKYDYAFGMAQRIKERMAEAYKRVREQVPVATKALMVLKDGAVEKYNKTVFPRTHSAKLRIPLDTSSAYVKGYVDGAHVNIDHKARTKLKN